MMINLLGIAITVKINGENMEAEKWGQIQVLEWILSTNSDDNKN